MLKFLVFFKKKLLIVLITPEIPPPPPAEKFSCKYDPPPLSKELLLQKIPLGSLFQRQFLPHVKLSQQRESNKNKRISCRNSGECPQCKISSEKFTPQKIPFPWKIPQQKIHRSRKNVHNLPNNKYYTYTMDNFFNFPQGLWGGGHVTSKGTVVEPF